MAGNNARVDAGYPQIGVTFEQQRDLLMSVGHTQGQAEQILGKRDGLSMPRELQGAVVNPGYPESGTVVANPGEVQADTPYPPTTPNIPYVSPFTTSTSWPKR